MNIYQFNPDDAFRFASEIGITAKRKGNELVFKFCPYCGSRKDKGTFAINLGTGAFNCKRASCGAKGNMLTLAKDFDFSLGRDVDAYLSGRKQFKNIQMYPRPKTKPKAVEYMETRGISKEIAESYAITTQRDKDNILVFPFFDENGLMQFVKYRNIEFVKGKTRGNKEWCEANCKPILFGMDKCNPEASDTLVMTEGQIDSLSCAEAGIQNTVSVPTGCNGFTWIPYCWDFLGKFKTLIIFGDYENGCVTLLAEMQNRFHGTVKHVREEDYKDCKDANEILQKYGKQALIDAVKNAVIVNNPRIKRMAEAKRIDLSKLEKFKTGINQLDAIIGGFYFGQLILLTGERGDGKSTLASQFGTWGLKYGYNIFYYSGELPEFMLKDWFDRQVAGNRNINKVIDSNGFPNYRIEANALKQMQDWYYDNVYFYDNEILTNNETEEETLTKTLKSAITQYGCRVLIIDNLMTAIEDDLQSDIYRQQTVFVRNLALMAKQLNILIILVAHPKKQGYREFSNDDVSGSSNITNLCDVVLRYTRPQKPDNPSDSRVPNRVLQIYKNRLTGKLDKDGIPLYYQESSKRIAESKYRFDWEIGWEKFNQTPYKLHDVSEFTEANIQDINGIFEF